MCSYETAENSNLTFYVRNNKSLLLIKLHFTFILKIKGYRKKGIILEEYTFVPGSENIFHFDIWTRA